MQYGVWIVCSSVFRLIRDSMLQRFYNNWIKLSNYRIKTDVKCLHVAFVNTIQYFEVVRHFFALLRCHCDHSIQSCVSTAMQINEWHRSLNLFTVFTLKRRYSVKFISKSLTINDTKLHWARTLWGRNKSYFVASVKRIEFFPPETTNQVMCSNFCANHLF